MYVAWVPNFEASALLVTDLSTDEALDDFSLLALTSLVAHFIALEAQLLVALERVVGVLSAKNAVHPAALIGTFPRKVPEFLTVTALNSRVSFVKVP